MDDLQIIDALKRANGGDKSAFTYIYNETYGELYNLALSLCRSPDTAEDLLQETYIDAFVKLKKVYNSRSLMWWLKGILVNEWREYVRREKRVASLYYEGSFDNALNLAGEPLSLQDYMEKTEIDQTIWYAVNSLPEKQRICILLYHYNNMSLEEISNLLKIPEGSVKSRLHYGRTKLSKMLKKDEVYFKSATPASVVSDGKLLNRILQALESASGGASAPFIFGSSAAGVAVKFGAIALSAGIIVSGVSLILGDLTESANSVEWPVMPSVSLPAPTTFSTAYNTTVAPSTTTSQTNQAMTVTFDVQERNGGVAIVKYTGNSTDVIIPKSINGKKVVLISDGAFANSTILRSVKIPDTVHTIESNAFRDCRNLNSISLGYGVNSVGEAAFLGCTSLKSVSVPSNVSNVGFYAFAYCTSLRDVKLSEGVQVLNYRAFYGCSNLSRVTLPATLSVIGDSAFGGTSSNLLLRVQADSYANTYATENGFNHELI